jgi:hypothetical protein
MILIPSDSSYSLIIYEASSSRPLNSLLLPSITTKDPNLLKAYPNSQLIDPVPMINRLLGFSLRSNTLFEVNNFSPKSLYFLGIFGLAPTAITHLSNLIISPSTFNVFSS